MELIRMKTTTAHLGSTHLANQSIHHGCRASRGIRFCYLSLLAMTAYLFCCLTVSAQITDSAAGERNESWTATRDLNTNNVNPTRIIESHSHNGNRTVDKQSVQRLRDGHYEPYQDIERETVQVDANTVRTTTRTFGRDVNGTKNLVQVTEEEQHSLPDGNSNISRTTSNPDVNGKLQPVQREIIDTKKAAGDAGEETKTTVMLPSIEGGLAPAYKTDELRKRGANDSIESQKTTLMLDGSANWQVVETRQAKAKEEANDRSTEERVSRLDSAGKLGEVSRVVTKESKGPSGEKRSTVETYALDVPGMSQDGSLHLVERTTSSQHSGSTGEQINESKVEKLDAVDVSAGVRVSVAKSERVQRGPSGEQVTRTIRQRDLNGVDAVVSVDTTKSDKVSTIRIEERPSSNPK